MQLTYRGTKYEAGTTQALEATAKPVTNLKYRGVAYRLNQVAQVESLNAVLKYRGAAYNPAAVTSTATSTVQERARLLTIDRQRTERNRQQSVFTRSAAEVGLAV